MKLSNLLFCYFTLWKWFLIGSSVFNWLKMDSRSPNNSNYLTHARHDTQTKREHKPFFFWLVRLVCSTGHLNWTDPWPVWLGDSSLEIKVMKWHSRNVNWHSSLVLQHRLQLMKHPWHTLTPGPNTLRDINLTHISLMKVQWCYCGDFKWGH